MKLNQNDLDRIKSFVKQSLLKLDISITDTNKDIAYKMIEHFKLEFNMKLISNDMEKAITEYTTEELLNIETKYLQIVDNLHVEYILDYLSSFVEDKHKPIVFRLSNNKRLIKGLINNLLRSLFKMK